MDLSPQGVVRRRQWLADVLCARAGAADEFPFADVADAIRLARSEGVLTLVAQGLQGRAGDDPLRVEFAAAAKGATAIAMLRGAECERVLAVLAAAGIPVLLLKGSALAWWLYPAPHLRECSDIDLLFASRDAVTRAQRLLEGHGYDHGYAQGRHAYELVCRRSLSRSIQLDLDLHWGLNNAPVFARSLGFDELLAASIPLPALGPHARGLSPAHALLHAGMHRAINLYTGVGDSLKWLHDVHLLAQGLAPSDWETVVTLCRERGLGGVCAASLEAAATWFGDATPGFAMSALQATRHANGVDGKRLHEWRYMHRMNLKALSSTAQRAAWIWGKVFPTVPHMREMYGSDAGWVGLWRERVVHLLHKSR
ncbi:nucleotidyltransferase family protein [Cognatiluteimonas profundi]|uniref:nucleotidyltransferase family protein n=1 Tax=Cognatiluteimonas profundi TaxID=2594501 RepID=UPI00131C975C|nr:nucleotidyltransferase family protein [Lysobacter profundi]